MQNIFETTRRGIRDTAHLIFDAFFKYPTRPFEVLFSLLLLSSAIVILNPTYEVYGNSQTFKYIQWLPEPVFGGLLLFVALMYFMALILNLHRQRLITAGVSAFLFSVMFILFFSANKTGMLIPWLGIIGIVSWVIFARILNDNGNAA